MNDIVSALISQLSSLADLDAFIYTMAGLAIFSGIGLLLLILDW